MWMVIEAIAIAFAAFVFVAAALVSIEPFIPPAYSGPAFNLDVPEHGPARGHSGGEIRIDGRRYETGA